jgi:hypothetical protein
VKVSDTAGLALRFIHFLNDKFDKLPPELKK